MFPGFICTLGFQLSLPSPHIGFTSLGPNSSVFWNKDLSTRVCVRNKKRGVNIKPTGALLGHCSCISEHFTNKKHYNGVYFYPFIAVTCLNSGWHQSRLEHFLKIRMPKAPPQFYQIRNYQVEVQGSEFMPGGSYLCVRDLGQANLLEVSIRGSSWGWEVGLEDLEATSQITALSGWFLVGRSQLYAKQ